MCTSFSVSRVSEQVHHRARTTPQHKILNRQVGWESRFHQQKVGRGSVLPTDTVGHCKSSRQKSFPTNIYLPTGGLTVLENLSRPTFAFLTVITF
jgi:hypothetical protein